MSSHILIACQLCTQCGSFLICFEELLAPLNKKLMLQVLAGSAAPKVVDLDANPSAAAPDTNNERKQVKVPIGGRGDGGDGGDGGGGSDGRRRWKWRGGAGPMYGGPDDDEEEEEEEDPVDYDDEIPAEDSDGVPLRWTACTACMQV